MTKPLAILAAGALAALCTFACRADAAAGDEAKIRALEARFAAAFNAKDVDAIMKLYVPGNSLLVFDVIPPRQYVGAQAYRKDWENLFAMFKGPVKFEVGDLAITTDRTLAYSHSIQHLTSTDANGRSIDLTVRVTDVYRKVKGEWLIEHEHVSVPVDLDSGKPDLASKP
jgi:uncharacterized protein (TIGR02246 family)